MRMCMKLKKDDTVILLAGKDRGQTGKVIKLIPEKNLVLVEGVNIVKKTIKPKSQQEKGGIIDVEAPISVSNVALYVKNAASRVGFKVEETPSKHAKKKRISIKTGERV